MIEDNWTDLVGEILDVRPSPTRKGFVEIEMAVREAGPVGDFANFLATRVGSVLRVKFREDCLKACEPVKGGRITVRARRGEKPDQVFAHTERFSIGPP